MGIYSGPILPRMGHSHTLPPLLIIVHYEPSMRQSINMLTRIDGYIRDLFANNVVCSVTIRVSLGVFVSRLSLLLLFGRAT